METNNIVFGNSHTANHYSIFIEGAMENHELYRDAIVTLYEAGENDKVSIFINSPGGYTDIGIALRNAVRSCIAETEAIIMGTAASAATFVALACDSLLMYDHTTFMVHDVSVASGYMTMNNSKIRTDYQRKWSEDLLIDIYGGFLTEDELIDLSEGRDFWFTPNQVMERLKNMVSSNTEEE